MRTVEIVNRICYAVCLITIVLGASTAVVGIWVGELADVAWKGMSTAGVLFLAGLATIAVNSALASRVVFRNEAGSQLSTRRAQSGPDGGLGA